MSSTNEFANIIEFNDYISKNLTKYDINTYFQLLYLFAMEDKETMVSIII